MRTFNFSIICLVALCFAHDSKAGGEPFYQPTHSTIRTKMLVAIRKKDPKEKNELLEDLLPHIEQRIERFEQLPFVAMAFRLSLFRVFVELDDKQAAAETARELVASYREELDPDEFRAWLICNLRTFRNIGFDEGTEPLLRAASEIGLSREDLLSGVKSTKEDDMDRDGVSNLEDKCHCFDDRRDSDRDGVPDACDWCWGHPDDVDTDEDGFPDGCDLCPGRPDLDRDLDDVPDGCDNYVGLRNPMEPRPDHDRKHEPDCECSGPPYPTCCYQPPGPGLARPTLFTSKTDRAGRVLESYKYTDFGELSEMTKWDGNETPLVITTFDYNKYRECIGYTEWPQDGESQPIKTKIFRDEEGRTIGKITEGEQPSNFNYYDKNSDILKVTTATDPPEEATILQRWERDEMRRVIKREAFIPESGRLEVVETNRYVENEDGSREVITRERIDSDSERLTAEGFSKDGRRIWLKDYPKPISPRGTRPREKPLVTRFEYRSEKAPGNGFEFQSQWTITILPSGVRQVDGWRVEGEYHKQGSRKIFESYTTTEEEPRDSDKKDWTKRIDAYFKGSGYETVEERNPSGAVVTYERDRHEPAYVLMQREIDASGHREKTYRYEYNDAGRTIREEIESDDRKQAFTAEYDGRGRVLMRGTETEAGTIEEHARYDAFDRIERSFVVVHSRDFSMVLPRWSVQFAETDAPYVLRGNGWETLDIQADSACEIETGSVLIRRIKRDEPKNDHRPQIRNLSGPEFRAIVEGTGGRFVGKPRKSTVTLCDRRKASIETVDITHKTDGLNEVIWLMTIPASSNSEWSVVITYNSKPKRGEDSDPICEDAEFVTAYLSSFCLDRSKFDVDATLLELSELE